MPAVFTNTPTGTSAALLDIGITTLILQAGEGSRFASPAPGEYQVIVMRTADWTQSEYLHVTSRSGDTLNVARGQEGSSQVSWPGGTIVEGIVTAGVLAMFAQAGASGLNNLADVTISNPQANQALVYTGSEWQNLPVPAPASLNDIGDVVINAPATNQMLRWNGFAWNNDNIPLNNLHDVVAPAPGVDHLLQFTGTQWVNAPMSQVFNGVELTHLGDVNAPTPAADDVIQRIGSEWVNQTPAQLAAKQRFEDLSDVNAPTPAERSRLEFISGQWTAVLPGLLNGAMQSADNDAVFTSSLGAYLEIDTLNFTALAYSLGNFVIATLPYRFKLDFDPGFAADDEFLLEIGFSVTFDTSSTSATFDFSVMKNGAILDPNYFVQVGTAGSHTTGLPLTATFPMMRAVVVNGDEISIAVRGNGSDVMTISACLLNVSASFAGPAGTLPAGGA